MLEQFLTGIEIGNQHPRIHLNLILIVMLRVLVSNQNRAVFRRKTSRGKMDDKITPEQTEKIAEWLGFKICNFGQPWNIKGHQWHKTGTNAIYAVQDQKYMRNWLSSPEGETAMIHKLLEPEDWNMNIGVYASGYRIRIRNFSEENDEVWVSRHEDLNTALQLVILTILKGQT